MKFPERFHAFMPERGKKADLMFVQHMVASLKSDGKMAIVMPHGVLFRGGEEKACRQRFIKDGILEAVIGLPSKPVLRHRHPGLRAGHEQARSQHPQERPVHQCRPGIQGRQEPELRCGPKTSRRSPTSTATGWTVEKYSRACAGDELEKEDFNLNIRRYVDNCPPPEPHDVRAHLHGGIPVAEIDQLGCYFANYAGVKACFSRTVTPGTAISPMRSRRRTTSSG